MSANLLIRGADVLTLDPRNPATRLDLRIRNGRFADCDAILSPTADEVVVDADGLVAMPGLVQTHTHLCQTLFRGLADDLELLPWLSERIWPFEAALSAEDLRAGARLGIAELLLGGTTSILDMGTVRHTDVLFEEAAASGLRYTGGKCIMDRPDGFQGLCEDTNTALSESVSLCKRWHGQHNDRLRYAFTPRFALSCTEEALRQCAIHAEEYGTLVHTHSSENRSEIAAVEAETGLRNIHYLDKVGCCAKNVVLAHGVWLDDGERQILRQRGAHIAHCPSSNLKLASGIADIAELDAEGISVTLGADGAPCNNNLDGFMELRLLALLHKVRSGPRAMPAERALHIATRQGAIALGLDDVGMIRPGFRADMILLNLNKAHATPRQAPLASRVVYSAKSSDVDTVIIDGVVQVRGGELVQGNIDDMIADADSATARVLNKANQKSR